MERTFTMKQIDMINIVKQAVAGTISKKKAAQLLGYSLRQIYRKVKRFKVEGPESLIHGNTGKPSNHKTSDEKEKRIIDIMTTKLEGFPPTHGAEMLKREFNVSINHETLRQIMKRHQLWESSTVDRLKHGWRERKAHFGELLQGDGSYHIWFGGRYSTLVAFIDDATNTVELMFAEQETIESMTELERRWLKKYGRPLRLYTDKGKVFKVNNAKGGEPRETQFERMNRELNIEISHAGSPQAKGRVEKLFGTLQKRLVKELAFYNITTIEEANKFLQNGFIDAFNQQFSNLPKLEGDLHRPLDNIDLKAIFCYKENRTLKRDRTIRHNNRWFLLDKKQPLQLQIGYKITVCTGFDGTIWLTYNDKRLSCKEITEPKKTVRKEQIKVVNDTIYRPPKNHPWREPGVWK